MWAGERPGERHESQKLGSARELDGTPAAWKVCVMCSMLERFEVAIDRGESAAMTGEEEEEDELGVGLVTAFFRGFLGPTRRAQ